MNGYKKFTVLIVIALASILIFFSFPHKNDIAPKQQTLPVVEMLNFIAREYNMIACAAENQSHISHRVKALSIEAMAQLTNKGFDACDGILPKVMINILGEVPGTQKNNSEAHAQCAKIGEELFQLCPKLMSSIHSVGTHIR